MVPNPLVDVNQFAELKQGSFHSPASVSEAISAATKLPIVLGGAPEEMTGLDYLASLRVRIALQGHAPFAAATQAVYETLKALREGTPVRDLKNIASADLMKRVTRQSDYACWTKDFLGGAS